MKALTLKVGAVATTLLVLSSSWGYAATHVKNPDAPLKPPVPTVAASPAWCTRARGAASTS